MNKHLEIEFKNMLNLEEYQQLQEAYAITADDFFTQTNIYFDTPTRALKQQKIALRIRLRDAFSEITFKEPAEVGLLETNIQLTLAERAAFDGEHLPDNTALKAKLAQYDLVPNDLVVLAALKTKRAEKQLTKEALLVLDESWYHGQHDFELELEVAEYATGLELFNDLLQTHKLTRRPAQNKIARALSAKTTNEERR